MWPYLHVVILSSKRISLYIRNYIIYDMQTNTNSPDIERQYLTSEEIALLDTISYFRKRQKKNKHQVKP
jgi:predicted DNA-binding helix-hairpin-helix protein